MNISQISKIHNENVINTFYSNTIENKNSDFESIFKSAISSLEQSQSIVAAQQKQFVNGEIEAHELLATVAESELTLKLASSIASKLVTGMQEITNIQI